MQARGLRRFITREAFKLATSAFAMYWFEKSTQNIPVFHDVLVQNIMKESKHAETSVLWNFIQHQKTS